MTRRRRILVLLICCMSLLIVALDNTIVNVALPALGQDLHAPVSGLQWTVDAYILTLAGLLMLSGSTADRVGRRRTFQTGLVVFTIGSLLCSLAPNLTAAGALLSQVTLTTPLPLLLGIYVVFGVGFGMLNPPITNTAVSGMPLAQVASTSRQVGQSLGVAIAGAVVSGAATGAAFVPAAHAAFRVNALYGLIVLSVALVTTGRWARRTAERAAERLPKSPGVTLPQR